MTYRALNVFVSFFLVTLTFSPVWGQEVTVEISPYNLLLNPGFEEGERHWFNPGWTADEVKPGVGAEQSVEGSKALRLSGTGGETLLVMQTLARVPEKTSQMTLRGWMRMEQVVGWQPLLRAELTRTVGGKPQFQYFTAQATGREHRGFQEYACTFEVTGDVQVLRAMLQGKSAAGSGPWQLWLDAVDMGPPIVVANRLDLTEFVPGGEYGLFLTDQPPAFSVQSVNLFDRSVTAMLVGDIRDFQGRISETFTQPITMRPMSKSQIAVQLERPITERGFYSVHLQLKSEDMAQHQTGSFAVVSPPSRRDPFFGFTGYGLPRFEKAAAYLGAGSGGMTIYPSIEREPGKVDFTFLDERLDRLEAYGLRPIANVFVSGINPGVLPRWRTLQIEEHLRQGEHPHTEAYYQQAARTVRGIVERYRDRIREWSVTLEIDLAQHHNPYEREHYLRRSRDVYDVVKSIDAQLQVASLGVSGVDMQTNPPLRELRSLISELHPHLDMIAFDAYIEPCSFGPGLRPIGPERGKLREVMQATAELSQQYGKTHFAIDEAGFNVINNFGSTLSVDSSYEKDMAAVLARSYIIARSIPEMSHWLYFKISGPLQGNRDWSLFLDNRMPRPAVAAFATVADRLAFAGEARYLSLHDDLWAVIFTRDQHQVVALWSLASEPVAMAITQPQEGVLYDLMNNPVIVPAGRQRLELSDRPVFLEMVAGRQEVEAMIGSADFVLPELDANVQLVDRERLRVTLNNLVDRPVHAQWVTSLADEEADASPARVELAARQGVSMDTVIPRMEGDTAVELTIQAEGGKEHRFARTLQFIPVRRLQGTFVLGEALAAFGSEPAIRLDSLSHLSPVDAYPNGLWQGPEDLAAEVYLAHDPTHLYLAVLVTDDVRVIETEGANLWRRDAIQFAIAPSHELLPEAGASPIGWEMTMGLTPSGPQWFCHAAPPSSGKSNTLITEWPFSVTALSPTRTLYKAAMPWEALGIHDPAQSTPFFNLIALDTDTPGMTSHYWMQITGGIAGGKHTALFRQLLLK